MRARELDGIGDAAHGLAKRRLAAAIGIAALLLYGCAADEWPRRSVAQQNGAPGEWRPLSVAIAEPGEDEVVIVVNLNSALGNHTGMFVAGLLSDPAGNYKHDRSRNPQWTGQPTLADYLRYQMNDGDRILVFRFRVARADRDAIATRVRNFGFGMPLFCAADVMNQIAGIGPFSTLAPVTWISPAGLADRLRGLVEGAASTGACVWPDGLACDGRGGR